MRNYRPITLLNVDFKILAKTLTARLLTHMNEFAFPQQNGFVPKRSILTMFFSHTGLLAFILIDVLRPTLTPSRNMIIVGVSRSDGTARSRSQDDGLVPNASGPRATRRGEYGPSKTPNPTRCLRTMAAPRTVKKTKASRLS